MFTSTSLKKATVVDQWCVRPGGTHGGFVMTHSKNVTQSSPDTKLTYKRDYSLGAPRWAQHLPCKREGSISDIVAWTMSDRIIYVSDGSTVYRLLFSKKHHTNDYDFVSLVCTLTKSTKVRYIEI